MSRRHPGAPTRRAATDSNSLPENRDDAGFTCTNCGHHVLQRAIGTHNRNHCPYCLWSLHVDVRPGDRAHLCRAPMEPIALWALADGERRIIHRCTRCGTLKANRIAGDDDETALHTLAARAVLRRFFDTGGTPSGSA